MHADREAQDGDRWGQETVGRQHLQDQDADPDYEEGAVVRMSRNPSVDFARIWYRGHPIPHLEAFRYPCSDDGTEQVYDMIETAEDGTMTVRPHTGRWKWHLTLDHRMAIEFDSEEELLHMARFIADAMAVAAGWTCHGKSYRINPHGPALRRS